MSKIIGTSTERMKADISSLQEQVGVMDKACDEAWEAVNSLNATWVGPAHDLLVGQFIADQETMKEMMASFREYCKELDHARKEFEKSDAQVSSLIRGVRI